MAVNLKIVSQVVTSGTPGPAGKSAYQIAVDNGFEGTESEWLKELHPFKGWFGSVSELEEEHSAPSVGEYAYVKGATSSDPVKIYECSTEGSWSDSGRTVDTSTVQTFRSGEAVNDVDITDDSSDIEENSDKIPTAGAVSDALGNVEFSTGQKVKNVGIDSEPIAGSENLVKSGGTEAAIYKSKSNSKILSFIGKGNTYSYGLKNGGFIPNQVYRIYIPVTDWDMSGITVTGEKFNIIAYNNSLGSTSGSTDVSINILKRSISSSIPSFYDMILPSVVTKNGVDINISEWFVEISGRATQNTEVRAIVELHNDLVSIGINNSYEYDKPGPKEVKDLLYNFQKGQNYEISLDATGINTSSLGISIYKDGTSIADLGYNINGINNYIYIPQEDYFGCYLRFYITSNAVNKTFTTSIRNKNTEILNNDVDFLSERVAKMNSIIISPSDLKVGGLYSGNIDRLLLNNRYCPEFFNVIANSSISFYYKERSDGGEVRVRVQFYTSDKTWISPNDNYIHLSNKKVPATAAYCRFSFEVYNENVQIEPVIENGEIIIDINNTIVINEALANIKENSLLKEKQNLTDEQVNVVTENLKLGGNLSVTINKTSSAHSSNNDKLNISVRKGQIIKFGLFSEIENPTVTSQFFLYNKEGDSIGTRGVSASTLNKWFYLECPIDVEYIGIYLNAATTQGIYTIKAIGGVSDNPQMNGVDIISLNKKAIEYIISAKCQAYKSPTNFGNYGKSGYNKFLAFLQLTDTHANFTCMERGLEFADNSGVISQVLHTGDIIESPNTQGRKETQWAQLLQSYNSPVLAIPGNHEFGTTTPYTDSEIHSWLYNSDYKERNGEIHPIIDDDEKNYWHKDIVCPDYYENDVLKSGKKIRIIGTYDFEFPDSEVGGVTNRKNNCWYTQNQIDWFVQKLDETLNGEYVGVMVLSHYILSKSRYLDVNFVPNEERGNIATGDIMSSSLILNSNTYFFAEILNAFINGTSVNTSVTLELSGTGISTTLTCNHTFASSGRFIANICGHKHAGGMLNMFVNESLVNEKLRVVMSPCSTNTDTQNTKWWGRGEYNSNSSFPNNVDCLNVIVYDHIKDIVKVIRVGSNINNNLEECNSFIF